MLGFLGNFAPSFGHLPGNPAYGVPEDAFASMNPYTALASMPSQGILQIVSAIFVVECFRITRILYGDKEPGDLGLGQTGFNPFGFQYTPEEYREKQVQEIKNGRVAMLGAIGVLLQAKKSGLGITEQLGEAFNMPAEREILSGMGTLGDYFPPNI
jgi:light-harvesting complex I chlorophyll a/b binding protein 1